MNHFTRTLPYYSCKHCSQVRPWEAVQRSWWSLPTMLTVSLLSFTLALAGESTLASSTSVWHIRRKLKPTGGHEHIKTLEIFTAAHDRDEPQSVLSFSEAGVSYTTEVGVGTPPTTYSDSRTSRKLYTVTMALVTLLLDTGLLFFWAGDNLTYVLISSSIPSQKAQISVEGLRRFWSSRTNASLSMTVQCGPSG